MNATPVLLRDPSVVYPPGPPFHPGEIYPEFQGGPVSNAPNGAYALVRRTLHALGLDADRFGTPGWNPLGGFIRPGMTVLLKPNLVLDEHPSGGDYACLITHGSVIRAMLDYAALALRGKGTIILGDSPLQGTDFGRAADRVGWPAILDDACARWPGISFSLVDFRQVHAIKDEEGNILRWREVPGDPRGYATFDLGRDSMLAPISGGQARFRVAKYRADDTAQYHRGDSHRYVVARSIIDADVILNLPKLKTHCKAGVTLALKNFVGSIGRKQCLAHHREGGTVHGGDEYPEDSRLKDWTSRFGDAMQGLPPGVRRSMLRLAWRVGLRVMKMRGVSFLGDGSWHGNDTVWRMTLDLVRIARYGRADGTLADTPQRPIFSLIDGIVAGEAEGPLEARARHDGVIAAGFDPVRLDRMVARYMGFDPDRIPLLRGARTMPKWPLTGEPAEDDVARAVPPFEAAEGWRGFV